MYTIVTFLFSFHVFQTWKCFFYFFFGHNNYSHYSASLSRHGISVCFQTKPPSPSDTRICLNNNTHNAPLSDTKLVCESRPRYSQTPTSPHNDSRRSLLYIQTISRTIKRHVTVGRVLCFCFFLSRTADWYKWECFHRVYVWVNGRSRGIEGQTHLQDVQSGNWSICFVTATVVFLSDKNVYRDL